MNVRSSALGVPAATLVLGCLLACAGEAPDAERDPLRIAVHGDPSTLDPHLQSEVIAQWVLGNVYEPLVTFDVNMRLVPALAERWENPADDVVRFHLRRGVTFHDGRPLTTADVASTLERARQHPRSRSAGLLVAIEEVRVIDEATIELRTATHYPILLNKLVFLLIVPEGSPETIEAPIGTGPYRFVAFEPGHHVTLEGFQAHWRGPPAEPRVEYHFVADAEARLARLLATEVDHINDVEPAEVARLEETPGFRVLSRSGLVVTYLQVNPAVEPFSDLRVRRALELAFDREALVRDVLLGQGRPVGQMVGPNVFEYAPDLAAPGPDPGEARRLLAEAGFPDGLDLTLEYRDGVDLAPVREQLAAVGVRLDLVARPWSEMYPRLQSGEVPFYFGSWVSTSGDASDLFDHKVHTRDPERGYGASNSNRYSNPELDRLIERAGTMKMEARGELLEQAMEMLAAEHVFVPLYTRFDLYGASEELEWMPRQDGRILASEMRRSR